MTNVGRVGSVSIGIIWRVLWNSMEGVQHLRAMEDYIDGVRSRERSVFGSTFPLEARQALLDEQIRNIGIASFEDTSKVFF